MQPSFTSQRLFLRPPQERAPDEQGDALEPGLGFFMPWPVVLVSVADPVHDRAILISIGAVAPTCAEPPALGTAVSPRRYSHGLLVAAREFVVNIPTAGLARAVDYCGCVSGREVDKFQAAGLIPLPGRKVNRPVAAQCPVNLECLLTQTVRLGGHDLFFGEIAAVQVSDHLLSPDGKPDADKLDPYTGVRGRYRAIGEVIGPYGFGKDLTP